VVLVEVAEVGKGVETSTREPPSDEVVVADAACPKPDRQSLELLRKPLQGKLARNSTFAVAL
jgi:hypothetical protein